MATLVLDAHPDGVNEVPIVDPLERAVHWLALEGREYAPRERSGLIELGVQELTEQIEWPPTSEEERR
ncbi:MAG TPA: hypothetical protein VL972_09670 [Solirubrobacteraceae bacterium]|nr:hypothetical protein [Solirubrobacteraceae bacterium]